jgi:hypothetical protein
VMLNFGAAVVTSEMSGTAPTVANIWRRGGLFSQSHGGPASRTWPGTVQPRRKGR